MGLLFASQVQVGTLWAGVLAFRIDILGYFWSDTFTQERQASSLGSFASETKNVMFYSKDEEDLCPFR